MTRLLLVAVLLAGVAVACSPGGGDTSPTATPTAVSVMQSPAGCSGRRPAESDARHTVSSGRIERSYLLHLPPSYDGKTPAPVVIAFHGYDSNPEQMERLTGLNEAADAAGMVTVVPSGTGQNLAWNVEQFPNAPDDVDFVGNLVKTLEKYFCVDSQRIYLAGFSNGGAMAYLAACLLPGKFAAIGVVGGYTRCIADVPLIAIHGTADPSVPYDGFVPVAGAAAYPMIPQLATARAEANGCQPQPQLSDPAPDVRLSTFTGCPEGEGQVQLYAVEGGGHTWPGSSIDIPSAGTTTKSINATRLMLDFFARFKAAP
ncbi:MAG TPA: PHB depolymerase family esterase [Tepidiformaceae bacterium]|nr:PHB depolymerase family esterase [Tepidiformaceae bacterium]